MGFENLVPPSDVQRTLFALMLMMGYGVHFAFVPHSLGAATQVAPRYRIVPPPSAVVMVSAGLSLFREHVSLMETYTWTGALREPARPGTSTFSNAFRYGNRIIAVPILLIRLPLAMGLPRAERHARSARPIVAGLGMVLTGLVGKFHETSGGSAYTIRAVVSTMFHA